jgi:hypothetical protein
LNQAPVGTVGLQQQSGGDRPGEGGRTFYYGGKVPARVDPLILLLEFGLTLPTNLDLLLRRKAADRSGLQGGGGHYRLGGQGERREARWRCSCPVAHAC